MQKFNQSQSKEKAEILLFWGFTSFQQRRSVNVKARESFAFHENFTLWCSKQNVELLMFKQTKQMLDFQLLFCDNFSIHNREENMFFLLDFHFSANN